MLTEKHIDFDAIKYIHQEIELLITPMKNELKYFETKLLEKQLLDTSDNKITLREIRGYIKKASFYINEATYCCLDLEEERSEQNDDRK